MTLYEWQCVVSGWNEANGVGPETKAPSQNEFEEAVKRARAG